MPEDSRNADVPATPGPEPERLKIEGDWKEALRKTVEGGGRPLADDTTEDEPNRGAD